MQSYEQAVEFHGHSCPGLAIGYRMSLAAFEALAEARTADEGLVAVVENDACGVDALQLLSGCTFGKGNLLFRDWGKMAFTVYSRQSGEGVRVLYHGRGAPAEVREDRERMVDWLLAAPLDDIVDVFPVRAEEPPPARIRRSLPCEACGEAVMETRLQQVGGRSLCVPCAEGRTSGTTARH